jgi:tetratricopeptide (TPR) repeat protein
MCYYLVQAEHQIRGIALRKTVVFQSILLAVALCSATTSAVSQEHAHEHIESIPMELLERPLPLRSGIGSLHDPVTTGSKQAQAYYDQGICYLHSYVWIEAARSFNEAIRLDPKLALGYLGLSYAYSGLNATSAAVDAAAKARSLSQSLSAPELARIAIREKQLPAIADPANLELLRTYRAAIDEALSRWPGDPQLWLLRGNAEEASAAGRGQHGGESSIRFYQQTLAVSNDNFAAHHYLTHSYENTGHIPEALKEGAAYARLAPAIPHAHHMYGHDLRRVGRMDEAIREFRKAYDLETEYYKKEGVLAEFDWHHQHNLDLLSTSYQYLGQMKSAEQLMRESFSTPSTQASLDFNKKELPSFLLDRGRAREALERATVLAGNRSEAVSAIGHIIASHALMSLGRMPEASEQAKLALSSAQGSQQATALLGPYLQTLQGEFYLRTGQAEKGRSILKTVESQIRSEPGPDAWSQALFALERIARFAREAGDWELAEYTARQMEQHDPYYAGTHYALAVVADHNLNRTAAVREFTLVLKYWQNADQDLPELAEARAKSAAIGKNQP